ncbi:DUF6200 domain-containing protein [Chondromyces apiculatus]|uniref:Uncharacterized protein n=1 Tax=Chondromyces apiculatus DSM 436 TaxID=1192034 RepID=A0A017SVE9_9BACT|nr:hypothetical protein [Chondromyces apiculatus]EYF00545.1 Hypothetical protein CAP_0474 [Chondromyces apiculatus DSM 436]
MEIETNNKDNHASALPRPTIIDLGKKSRKRVKKLRKGKSGGLLAKVQEVLEQMKEAGAISASAQPVVVIVRERRRKSKYGKLWGMG